MKKWIILLIMILMMISGTIWYFTDVRMLDLYTKKVIVYTSFVDQDGDGVDDQTDILQNAITYVKTKPEYESKYYATGYPDDQYGVCTDVVAFALLNAGYDLQELVSQDIAYRPEAYNIEKPDRNIDFRRVKNLKVYFDSYAYSLPTDFSDITVWQGGDIVLYENHIGIVSDRRNTEGIPYIIHHYGKRQFKYETNTINDHEILGHYRIS